MPPKLKFSDGEKVLCYHGPLIYEAKCLKSSVTKDKQVKYFIHYAGWNKNWDEWVPENRVLKYNESNVSKQKEVLKLHANQAPKAKKSKNRKSEPATSRESDSRASTPSMESNRPIKHKLPSTPNSILGSEPDAPKRKRGKLDSILEPEEQYLAKIDVKIKIPEELKTCLVEDWDLINRQKKLVCLPAKSTIDDILDSYIAHKNPKGNNGVKDLGSTELSSGIKDYFNVLLGTQLLYKSERQQYEDIITENPDKQVSALYGGVHLLRMFVKLSTVLAYTPLDERGIEFLSSNLHEFLKYFAKNHSTFFNAGEYENMSVEYQKKLL